MPRLLQFLILLLLLPWLAEGQKKPHRLKGVYVAYPNPWGWKQIVFRKDSFQEQSGGCMGHFFGAGTYRISGDSLFLNYARHKADTPYYKIQGHRDSSLQGIRITCRVLPLEILKGYRSVLRIADGQQKRIFAKKFDSTGTITVTLDSIPKGSSILISSTRFGYASMDIDSLDAWGKVLFEYRRGLLDKDSSTVNLPAGSNVLDIELHGYPYLLDRWHRPGLDTFTMTTKGDSNLLQRWYKGKIVGSYVYHHIPSRKITRESRKRNEKMWVQVIEGTYREDFPESDTQSNE